MSPTTPNSTPAPKQPMTAAAPRYSAALGEHDPIDSQRKAPKRFKRLVKGLSEKQLARRPGPDKWSIKEVLAHLADGEFVLGARIRCVAAMDRPTIVGYDENAFVRNLAVDKAKTDHFLAAFAAARALNVELLERLPKESFARVGVHTERGEESLTTMVIMYAGHDRIHEAQIERIKAQLFPPKEKKSKKLVEEKQREVSNAKDLAPKSKDGKKKHSHELEHSHSHSHSHEAKSDQAAEHFAKAEKQARKEEKRRRKEACMA